MPRSLSSDRHVASIQPKRCAETNSRPRSGPDDAGSSVLAEAEREEPDSITVTVPSKKG
jgi:hypothetical protein